MLLIFDILDIYAHAGICSATTPTTTTPLVDAIKDTLLEDSLIFSLVKEGDIRKDDIRYGIAIEILSNTQ